jgi:type VI secretion system protein ImpK
MSDRVYEVCSDVLMLAVTFPLSAHLPPPAELRQRLQTALDAMVGRGRQAGIPEPDLADMRYALVAFIDEQLLKSTWPGRSEWMGQPLQLVLFNQYDAGETFFSRLNHLLNANRPEALAAYYLCLALGFRGQYGVSGDMSTLNGLMQAAQQQLARTLPRSDKLGPHAIPAERARQNKSSNAPFIALIVGSLLLTAAVLVGLAIGVRSEVKQTIDAMPRDPTAQLR